MAGITVRIVCDEAGNYSVGAEAAPLLDVEGGGMGEGAGVMPTAPEAGGVENPTPETMLAPVPDLDAALAEARRLLVEAGGEAAEATEGEAQFEEGYGRGAGRAGFESRGTGIE